MKARQWPELLGRMKHEGGSMKEYVGNLLVAFGHQEE
jgi:hypothetical protein